jgi:predicted phage terminase large subunit-like protein
MLRVDMVMEDEHFPEGLEWFWAWDVASTEKEVATPDPDFSVGHRLAWKDPDLYIDSVVYGRWKALERDRKIRNHAERGAPLFVEAVGGYKDMVEYVKKLVAGIASRVEGMGASRDLVARASVRLEALFESSHVHVRKGAKWLPFWKRQIGAFPSSHEHDDCVASLVTGLEGIIGSDDEWGFSR